MRPQSRFVLNLDLAHALATARRDDETSLMGKAPEALHETLLWLRDAERLPMVLPRPFNARNVDAMTRLSGIFNNLLARPSSPDKEPQDARTRQWCAEVLTMRLFDSIDTNDARQVLGVLLTHETMVQFGTSPHALPDAAQLPLVTWTVAWRRLLDTPGVFDVLEGIQERCAGAMPPRDRARMLVEACVLATASYNDKNSLLNLAELQYLTQEHPELAPLLAHLQRAIDFLNAHEGAQRTITPLIDHLLRDDTMWTASDTQLLLHLSHMVVGSDGEDRLPRSDRMAMHHKKLVMFSMELASKHVFLTDEQALGVEDAAVRLLQHLASLVPQGKPAHADAVLALLPAVLREKALERLTPGERARFVAEEALV